MKRILLVVVSALLLLSGCTKDGNGTSNGDKVSVTIEAGLENSSTKATSDYDGNAKKVNHWVMEVRDSNGNLYTREERSGVTAGTLEQTFSVTLVKGNSYSFQFWADTKGMYNTGNLTAVSSVNNVANRDSRDAFSANVDYTPAMDKSITATLTRPFAQLNIQTTDLETLWTTMKGATSRTEYDRFEPNTLKAILSIPTTFNVKTQESGSNTSVTLTAGNVYTAYQSDKATSEDHNNYYNHANPATLFMDYILAGVTESSVNDITFSFVTNGQTVSHSFTNIPFQRNYRTNIKGNLLSDDTAWTVTINPNWSTPEKDVQK